MSKEAKYTLIAIALALPIGIGLGWWLGYRSETTEVVREKVRYVELPPTTIGYRMPEPIKVERIDLPRIQYTDTIREEVRVPIPADTTAIVADYLKRRVYDLDFSSDTTGVFKVNAIVEANHLASATATIQPLQREVERTIVKVRKFRPLAEVGAFANYTNIGLSLGVGGIINEKHIVTAKYLRLGKQNVYGAEYAYIFGQ